MFDLNFEKMNVLSMSLFNFIYIFFLFSNYSNSKINQNIKLYVILK